MRIAPILTGTLICLLPVFAPPAADAQRADSATVIVRFGTDTLAVEQWVRTADGLDAVSVTRSPTTTVRRYAVRFGADGRVTRLLNAQGVAETVTPTGAIPTASGFYAPQAIALAQASRARDTLAVVPMLAGGNVQEFRVRRIGPDLFELVNPAGATTMRARLTREGGLIYLEAGTSTTVERVGWVDVDALAREFSARDARGAGIGPLSGRDTASARAAGATIMVDYGQPSARGRTIFGGLVPYGQIWRLGANDATQLVVDRPVRVGDVNVEPGTYSLYAVPGRDQWELGVSRMTGMAAAMSPDPAQDVGRARMSVRSLPQHVEPLTMVLEQTADGAMLRIRWETTEASVPIVVRDGM
ncbi:MAG: DUF2911 domain-containing protein [Gemmatimonadetes bacterium]|nr:DUF2911 domain-containing protein [Gemmatimonadota bacterium]